MRRTLCATVLANRLANAFDQIEIKAGGEARAARPAQRRRSDEHELTAHAVRPIREPDKLDIAHAARVPRIAAREQGDLLVER